MAKDTKIHKIDQMKSDAYNIRDEIRRLREVREEMTTIMSTLTDYEGQPLTSKKSIMIKSSTEIIKSLKTTYKNMKNYIKTIEAFNKDAFNTIDTTGGTIPSPTPSSASVSTGGSKAISSAPAVAVSTVAIGGAAGAGGKVSAPQPAQPAKTPASLPSNINIGGYYTASQIKNKSGYYAVPNGKTSAKAYESWAGITLKGSPERAISHGETYKGVKYDTHTEASTGMRYVNINGEKYYCIATGSAYGEVGDKLEIKTSTGKTFKAIKTDTKRTNDGNSKVIYVGGKAQSVAHGFGNGNNCVIEMVCDVSSAPSKVKNWGSYDALDQFSGNIKSIRNLGSTFK